MPQDNATETFDQLSFFIDRLEEDTGNEIELYEASDLAAVIEATIAGDLDIVHLGPLGQMIARDNGAEITAVGATAPTPAGPNNASVAVVREDSPFTKKDRRPPRRGCTLRRPQLRHRVPLRSGGVPGVWHRSGG